MVSTVIVAVAILLVLLGVLLGWTWAVQAYDRRSRAQAETQRLLNDERQRLDEARRFRRWRR